MKADRLLYSALVILALLGTSSPVRGQEEGSRPDQVGLRMSWFSLGVAAGINDGISARIGIWRYGKLELSVSQSEYTRYFREPTRIHIDWYPRTPNICIQGLYRQYWPAAYRLGWDQLKLAWGLSAGMASLKWSREAGWFRGAVSSVFCELWILDRVSLQADLFFYYSPALDGQVGIGPAATLYYNF